MISYITLIMSCDLKSTNLSVDFRMQSANFTIAQS